jgi:hypothetical protein
MIYVKSFLTKLGQVHNFIFKGYIGTSQAILQHPKGEYTLCTFWPKVSVFVFYVLLVGYYSGKKFLFLLKLYNL